MATKPTKTMLDMTSIAGATEVAAAITAGSAAEITATLASQAEAEAGTEDATLMTPLRVAQAITALAVPASKAPLPIAGDDVGQWADISQADNTALTLPAGGTWAYFSLYIVVSGMTIESYNVGIGNGGATLRAGAIGKMNMGFAFRIT